MRLCIFTITFILPCLCTFLYAIPTSLFIFNDFSFLYIYMYPSHFNCVGVVSVVLSPDYEPHSTGLTTRRSRCDCARAKMEQARATWCWSD